MGSLAAVRLANLYCHMEERRYVVELVKKGDEQTLKDVSWNLRFVDDILWVGEQRWPDNLYEHLKLNETTRSDGSIVYLGMHVVKWRDGPLIMEVHDKDAELGMQMIRYPQASSVAPPPQIRGGGDDESVGEVSADQ